ncbi:hypothetical protein OBBRIDRAFT_90751 [Obba rivulosa]|uniref:F-box domain-containing protein n=1 Tax=Obba rivulosa TaxID=1052685 RepID=A0A8E2DHM9_9APHY|nr:hypothetical protein OBBRIDRAFT_90751 [Obba rivulosa]
MGQSSSRGAGEDRWSDSSHHLEVASGALRPQYDQNTSLRRPSQLSVGPTLPLELWDDVIDYFGEPVDRPTLLSCALVCRAWLPRSRRHLFRTVYVRTSRQLRRLSRALDKSQDICPLVREFTVCPDEEAAEMLSRGLDLLSRLPCVIDFAITPSLLCPNVSLTSPKRGTAPPVVTWPSRRGSQIRSVEVRVTMQIYTLNRQLKAYDSVTSLTLSLITFLDFSDLARMLCELPNLLYLYCGDVQWVTSGYNPLGLEQHRDVVLKKLISLGVSSNVFLKSGLKFVLGAAGTSLRRFMFAVIPKESTEPLVAQNLDLGRFLYLESVELGCWIHHPEWDFAWIPTALESISSGELVRITLKYPLYSSSLSRQDVLDRMLCHRMEEVLSDQRFAKVQEVIFQFEDVVDHEQWWISQLATRLPSLYSRNIVRLRLRTHNSRSLWREGLP